MIAPLNGHLGTCSGSAATAPFQTFKLNGVPAVEIAPNASCRLGCLLPYRGTGNMDVHCGIAGNLTPAHCTQDTLTLFDDNDSSYLRYALLATGLSAAPDAAFAMLAAALRHCVPRPKSSSSTPGA